MCLCVIRLHLLHYQQAAIPDILEKTPNDFHSNNLGILREVADIFYDGCKEIPCLTCPLKPEGAMVVMVSGMKNFTIFIMLWISNIIN